MSAGDGKQRLCSFLHAAASVRHENGGIISFKPRFSSEGVHTSSAKNQCSSQHKIPPAVQVPVHRLPAPVQTGLMVKSSHGRPPASFMILEAGCVQSVPDCLVTYCYENL